MRRLSLTLITLVLMTGLIPRCDAGDEALDWEARKQVYRLAEEMLAGRSLLLRIYADPAAHPDAFQRVTIPLKGSTVSVEAITSVSGPIPDKAIIVVLGSDQPDRQVAAVLDSFVFARTYRAKGESLYLQPSFFDDPGYEWWEFLDALGQPIPEASVEIGLYDDTREAKIVVGKGKLDAQGRLKRIKGNFVFTISHLRYGIATTECYGQPETKDLPDTYLVPLVPLDSPAAAGTVRGTVTDTRDRPVAGVAISCMGLPSPAGEQAYVLGGKFQGTGITNEQGRFAVYWPIWRDGVPSDSPVPAGSTYHVRIEPGKSLNLRLYEGNLVAGTTATITLSAMQADEFFHTFTFEGQVGPITDPEELKRTTLTLYRDDRKWTELTYDQWKNGCTLPTGTLRAFTQRWHQTFLFKPVDLRGDSPQEIVIKEYDPVTYRGRVVDDTSGQPVPNVLVTTDSSYAGLDPCSVTPQRWQELRGRAAEQASVQFPGKPFYDYDSRLAVTDANGQYEILFVPGLNSTLAALVAMQPGFAPSSTSLPSYIRPDTDGIVQAPTLRLASPTKPAPSYFPIFVVEDDKGPVTDPNKLKAVQLQILGILGGEQQYASLDYFLQRRQFTPGVYHATATWDDKYYVFQPVDLSESRPQTVVLRPREVLADSLACQGSVIHGITGRPISQALVMDFRFGGVPDLSQLTAEQWKAIKAMGPDMDPAQPALAPLLAALSAGMMRPVPRMAMTDAQGRFRIAVERADADRCRLAVLGENFLCTEQRLVRRRSGDPTQAGSLELYGVQANGQVTLPPIKLFPAGTVLLEPITPEHAFSDGRKPQMVLSIRIDKDDPAPWLKDLQATPAANLGASVSLQKEIPPNARQSLYVPAGISTALLMYDKIEGPIAPLFFPDIRVQQGQTLDLGRLEFGPGVTVTVKVVDSLGNPVKEARIYCVDDRYGQYGTTAPTDGNGTAEAHVSPFSKGKFALYHFGRSIEDRQEASVPYEVGGPEDDGREFLLQPSDEFLQRLREPRRERPLEAMPIQPLRSPTKAGVPQER